MRAAPGKRERGEGPKGHPSVEAVVVRVEALGAGHRQTGFDYGLPQLNYSGSKDEIVRLMVTHRVRNFATEVG